MIDIQLLRLLRKKQDFHKIMSSIKIDSLELNTRKIVHAVKKYYNTHKEHDTLDFSVFIPFVERSVYPDLNVEDRAVLIAIIKNMAKKYPDEETRALILESILCYKLGHDVGEILEKYTAGDEIDLYSSLENSIDMYKKSLDRNKLPEVEENIDDLLDSIGKEEGITWRLPCINKTMRPLRAGDFGIVAARPDQGKTSFMASELTWMASQLPQDQSVVWLNNEGLGVSILPRLMQAALSCTTEDLVRMKQEGALYEAYWKALNGKNKIRIMDIHGWNTGQVDRLLSDTKPSIVVYDMIDNIKGFADAARTDLALERMYQWARELSVKHNVIGIATSQISSDGADSMFPGMGMLKDSKTGKQGACDFIMMIGSMENKPEFENTRWLSVPKNKLRKMKSCSLHEQVTFNKDTARYTEIKEDI